MNYVLVDKKQLDEKDVFPFAELLPDGRAILSLSALKTVTGLIGIDIVDSDRVKELQAEAPPGEGLPVDPVIPPAEENKSDKPIEKEPEEEVVNE